MPTPSRPKEALQPPGGEGVTERGFPAPSPFRTPRGPREKPGLTVLSPKAGQEAHTRNINRVFKKGILKNNPSSVRSPAPPREVGETFLPPHPPRPPPQRPQPFPKSPKTHIKPDPYGPPTLPKTNPTRWQDGPCGRELSCPSQRPGFLVPRIACLKVWGGACGGRPAPTGEHPSHPIPGRRGRGSSHMRVNSRRSRPAPSVEFTLPLGTFVERREGRSSGHGRPRPGSQEKGTRTEKAPLGPPGGAPLHGPDETLPAWKRGTFWNSPPPFPPASGAELGLQGAAGLNLVLVSTLARERRRRRRWNPLAPFFAKKIYKWEGSEMKMSAPRHLAPSPAPLIWSG
ncbi:basic proline-rich protein-like [Nomascus leucogenys]|uniref:basic proline-rich protein-like n=1 Tax=Nomascus leucogenys TaxID=61853 RepID=UPI0002ADADF0|nr:basic proline-rich protein-like [Nomascus leucogenys]